MTRLLLFIIFTLSGCATPNIIEKMEISRGQSLQEIDTVYGPPFRLGENDREVVAEYYFGKSEMNASGYIPFINFVAGTSHQKISRYTVTYSGLTAAKIEKAVVEDSAFKISDSLKIFNDKYDPDMRSTGHFYTENGLFFDKEAWNLQLFKYRIFKAIKEQQ